MINNEKILIFGGNGMLGHKLFQRLRDDFHHTYCTLRAKVEDLPRRAHLLFPPAYTLTNIDIGDEASVDRVLNTLRPTCVINCIGVIKQRDTSKMPIPSIGINSLFPHVLAAKTDAIGGKFIHFSTDCVFSGSKGLYREEDFPDARDLYGRSKLLGEVDYGNAITLRSSIIGRELQNGHSLVTWFLSQDHRQARGFKRAVYSGVTTEVMAKIVRHILMNKRDMSGLYQIASQAITKYDLLVLIKKAYGLDVEILPDTDFVCDRSLIGDRFLRDSGFVIPTWPWMVQEMAQDSTPY